MSAEEDAALRELYAAVTVMADTVEAMETQRKVLLQSYILRTRCNACVLLAVLLTTAVVLLGSVIYQIY